MAPLTCSCRCHDSCYAVDCRDVIEAAVACGRCAGAHALAMLDPLPPVPPIARERTEWIDPPVKPQADGDTDDGN